ncbi:MAG: PAS domain S-box protein [Magnetococcales bacterium]|nr:PAS domain S-box protein [Magnetococcales bacterium]
MSDPTKIEERWKRRMDRERKARKEAERLLEEKSRELWKSNQELKMLTDNLSHMVVERTERIRAIVETAVDAIITINHFGIIATVNPAVERLFGWTEDELVGKNVTILIPRGKIHDEHDSYLSNYLKTGKSSVIGAGREVTAIRKNGQKFPAFLSVGHATPEDGQHLFVGFLSDITKQKKAEQELVEAKEDAIAGAKAKSAFMANMSHEIRTPMNAIIGFAEVIINSEELSQQNSKHAGTILNSAKSLLRIINDILDVSKLESGKFSLESICFNLHNALIDMLRTIEHQATEKNIALRLEYDTSLEKRFIGDPTRLRQIFLNLVGNSIKFTEKGEITVSVKPTSQLEILQISVVDTGIGMSPDQIKNIFQAFSQADESTTRRFGGTGLGTSISKQIVEQMGGSIWVESALGEGSTFHFTTKLKLATKTEDCLFEDGAAIASEYVSPRLFKILLAEDIIANATLAILRLEQQGHTVFWAKNGREVITESQNNSYDIILMDIMMPELDGLDATIEIRKLEEKTKTNIAIIALTASVMQENHLKCRNAGMDDVVAKPIDFNQLFSTMEKVVPEGVGRQNTSNITKIGPKKDLDFTPLTGIINYEKALKTWQDETVYAKSLISFSQDCYNYTTDLETFLSKSPLDRESAKRVAHTLKGVAGNLGIEEISKMAAGIESQLKTDGQIVKKSSMDELRKSIESIVSVINTLKVDNQEKKTKKKEFDSENVQKLMNELFFVLDNLDPDVTEPILLQLSEYLANSELEPIQKELDSFDFDMAKTRTSELAIKLDLKVG